MSVFEGKIASFTGAGGETGRFHAIEFAKRVEKVDNVPKPNV